MPDRLAHEPDRLDVPGIVTWTALGAAAIALVLAILYVTLGRLPEETAPAPERLWTDRSLPPPRLSMEPRRELTDVRADEEVWFRSVDLEAALAETARRGWREGERYPVPGRRVRSDRDDDQPEGPR